MHYQHSNLKDELSEAQRGFQKEQNWPRRPDPQTHSSVPEPCSAPATPTAPFWVLSRLLGQLLNHAREGVPCHPDRRQGTSCFLLKHSDHSQQPSALPQSLRHQALVADSQAGPNSPVGPLSQYPPLKDIPVNIEVQCVRHRRALTDGETEARV